MADVPKGSPTSWSWQSESIGGLAIFGDGSDGDVTIAANTTLTRDMFYNNLTINAGIVLNTGGYRIFVKGTLTNNGTIERNGNDATDSAADAVGAVGAALPTNSLGGSGAGGAGIQVNAGESVSGSGGGGGGVVVILAETLDNGSGTISANGGEGGNAYLATAPGGTNYPTGSGGAATAPIDGIRGLPLSISARTLNSIILGGGGGGGGPNSGSEAVNAGGSVDPSMGGAGGNGGTIDATGEVGGGGGGGGGCIILIYNSATWGTEQANGGVGGTGAGGGGTGQTGSAGTIIKIANT
jgi:hypothetical protein